MSAAAVAEIEALRTSLDEVCDSLMDKAELGLRLVAAHTLDRDALNAAFSDIMTLCAFQDLAGQRLARMKAALEGAPEDSRPDAALLNGPANSGGLDQSSADALFDDATPPPGFRQP